MNRTPKNFVFNFLGTLYNDTMILKNSWMWQLIRYRESLLTARSCCFKNIYINTGLLLMRPD